MTPLQIETLRKIARGEVENVKFGYGAWRTQGASPTVVGRLVNTLKFAHWGPVNGNRQTCALTVAGEEALAALA